VSFFVFSQECFLGLGDPWSKGTAGKEKDSPPFTAGQNVELRGGGKQGALNSGLTLPTSLLKAFGPRTQPPPQPFCWNGVLRPEPDKGPPVQALWEAPPGQSCSLWGKPSPCPGVLDPCPVPALPCPFLPGDNPVPSRATTPSAQGQLRGFKALATWPVCVPTLHIDYCANGVLATQSPSRQIWV
jgi:hypothetical protein